jgi:hypothetical protein
MLNDVGNVCGNNIGADVGIWSVTILVTILTMFDNNSGNDFDEILCDVLFCGGIGNDFDNGFRSRF